MPNGSNLRICRIMFKQVWHYIRLNRIFKKFKSLMVYLHNIIECFGENLYTHGGEVLGIEDASVE